jgi:tRNA nucleotidyltransferase (CCA-adding enzyme)
MTMSKRLDEAKRILHTLTEHGYDAYIVGGYVRDHLMGRDSDDIDITTSATPDEVTAIFPTVKPTGKMFGGVTVFEGDYSFEVTTFRHESAYVKHRYPSEVTFSKELSDDVIRRDFTVNGLVMDQEETITDLVGGQADLASKTLRAIGDPTKRFEEDALRILRALRFISKLGFTLEQSTKDAIQASNHLVETVKIERIMQELDKILKGTFQNDALTAMMETGVDAYLFGLQQGIQKVSSLKEHINPLEFFIISFVLDDIQDVWRFSNKDYRLIRQVMTLHEVTKEDQFNTFILFSNKLEPCLITNRINVLLGYPDQETHILTLWDRMPVKDVCDLAYKGQDILQDTNLSKRSLIGLVIDDLLEVVLDGSIENTYDALKPFALQRIRDLQHSRGDNNE